MAETRLTADLAAHFATVALGHVRREYPHKLDHVFASDADARTPRALHPVFYGSFDWHSCVHGYWMLTHLRRRFPAMAPAAAIAALLADMLTPENVAGELAYLERPESRGFERPYGWAWLLKLQAELEIGAPPQAAALRPLAQAFAARFQTYLPALTYPLRVGTHGNTAFAIRLALDWAESHDPALDALLRATARRFYLGDTACQAWEPDGDAFLYPALIEAECMRRALPAAEFAPWLAAFLPRLAAGEPATLFQPAVVSDRGDGKLAHLDGLNFARAWCFRALARDGDGLAAAAETHLRAALPHVAGDYAGAHWLASFAVLALDGGG